MKKALAVGAMVLANANETDRALTLKAIRAKSVEVTDQRLLDQVIPKDPPMPRLPTVADPKVTVAILCHNYCLMS